MNQPLSRNHAGTRYQRLGVTSATIALALSPILLNRYGSFSLLWAVVLLPVSVTWSVAIGLAVYGEMTAFASKVTLLADIARWIAMFTTVVVAVLVALVLLAIKFDLSLLGSLFLLAVKFAIFLHDVLLG